MAAMMPRPSSSSVCCSRGWVTGVHGGVAQVRVARQRVQLEQVGEVDRPLDVVDLALLDLQRADDLLAQDRVDPAVDLDPHDLAEAAAAQLGLDGLEQVVGLVGDLEVGVARDPEDAVVDDLHAREQRVEVAGDDLLERHEDVLVAVGDLDEARQQLLGHLHAGEGGVRGRRVADEHRQAQREVGDVGERAAEPDGQRRQHGEDLAAEALGQHRPLARGQLVRSRRSGCRGLRAPAISSSDAARLPLAAWRRTRSRIASIVSDGVRPSASGSVRPASTWSCRPGDADHEELVEVGGPDRRELHALQQRRGAVLGELEHPVVEVQPRQLAVEVQLGRREVRLALGGLGVRRRRRDVADRLLGA